jgi:hypothetical protein
MLPLDVKCVEALNIQVNVLVNVKFKEIMSTKHKKLTRLVCPACDMYTYSKLDGLCHNKGCESHGKQTYSADVINKWKFN